MTLLARPGGSPAPAPPLAAPRPERKGMTEQVALVLFIAIPFLALLAAVPFAWGGGLGWHDVVIALVFYAVAGHGITVGFHRYFTHGSFQARRWLRVTLALAGSLAIEGPVIRWVADHRKHHAFSDRQGDPHSPWRYGETRCRRWPRGCGGRTPAGCSTVSRRRGTSTPPTSWRTGHRRVEAAFPAIVAFSVLAPALIGGLWSMSWQGAVTAFFWASILRIGLLHHVTWSINSICHAIGERPFRSRDRSANVWWLAILSMGESWHNLHHADPTCARHGVDPASSTPAPASSGRSSGSAGPATCAGPGASDWRPGAWRRDVARPGATRRTRWWR